MSFYMVAGTVDWGQGTRPLIEALKRQQLDCALEDDEILIEDPEAELSLRPGFAHQWILVGDAGSQPALLAAVQRLSTALERMGTPHAFELHAPDNRLIGEVGSP